VYASLVEMGTPNDTTAAIVALRKEGYSFSEIGARLGISKDAAQKRHRRAAATGFFYPQIGPYTRRLRLGTGPGGGNPLCYPKRQPDLLDVAMANARAKGFASPIATSSDD